MNAVHRRSVKRKAGQAQSWGLWLFALGCISALVVAMGVGLVKTHAQETFPLPAINPPGAKAPPTQATSTPAAGKPNQQPTGQQAAPTADDAQKQEVANQCADLLQMATDLKAAVDKSSADTLSVAAMRKAGQIEQFARKARTGDTEKR